MKLPVATWHDARFTVVLESQQGRAIDLGKDPEVGLARLQVVAGSVEHLIHDEFEVRQMLAVDVERNAGPFALSSGRITYFSPAGAFTDTIAWVQPTVRSRSSATSPANSRDRSARLAVIRGVTEKEGDLLKLGSRFPLQRRQ